MLTHDALATYVADRRRAREQAAATARTGRLLRRARRASSATGSAADGSSPAAGPIASSPVAAPATGAPAGIAGEPAVVDLRTAATAGPRRDAA